MNRLLTIILTLLLVSCNTSYYAKNVKYNKEFNRPEKVIRLNLSHHQLKELPEDILEYKNLKSINLSRNPEFNLDSTFKVLAQLPQLEVLILDSNKIESLPKSIQKLKSLKHISLVNNPSIHLNDVIDQLKYLPLLTTLNLSNNNLKEVPNNIHECLTLQNLRLSNNNVNTPISFSRLAKVDQLKFLWLDHNNISELPKTINELNQVSELYLGNNQIKELPQEITECKNLCILYLGDNQFKTFPEQVLKMKTIYMLVIYGNEISTIPDACKEINNHLSILVLDNNRLDEKQIKIAKEYFTGFFLLSVENQKEL